MLPGLVYKVRDLGLALFSKPCFTVRAPWRSGAEKPHDFSFNLAIL